MDSRFPMAFAALTISALGLTGCPNSSDSACDDVVCQPGYVCDVNTGRCTQKRLETYQGPLPGRGVRIDAGGDVVFVAAIDPRGQSVVAGTLEREDRDVRVLADLDRPRNRLALDATENRVVVAWLGERGRFRYAWRRVDGSNAYWEYVEVIADSTYAGTDDFDIVIGETGPYFAFRATDDTLRILRPRAIDGPFELQTIDDGSPSANGITCSDDIRAARQQGVGYEPDLLLSPDQELLVSYQDADCGDLRVARSLSGAWSVDVVDTGAFEFDTGIDQRGRTGRYSSVAIGTQDRVGVSYFDVSRGQLKLARSTDQGWEIQVVDDGLRLDELARERKDIVGTFSSLTYDSEGTARIAYMNATTLELRLAERVQDGTRWVIRTIATDRAVGFSAHHIAHPTHGTVVVGEALVPTSREPVSSMVTSWD